MSDLSMQVNASDKPASSRSGSGAGAMSTQQTKPSTAPLPNQLDLSIGSVIEGVPSGRTLMDICMDLFGKLEGSLIANRSEFISDYFTTMVKQDEMTSLWTDPSYYEHLRLVVQNEVLPLYDRYCTIRDQVFERTQKRSWTRYCMWTVGFCLGLELLFTEGRVLRPFMLLPAVVVDGLLGYGIYYLVNYRDISALRRANQNLLNSIRDIDTKHEVAKRYEIFRSFSGGELLAAELQTLLASYPSPDEFWNDYFLVRKADPTTPEEVEKLGCKRFNVFLQLHIRAAYSAQARQQRFNALFLLAHKTFILNNPDQYALNHLRANNHSICQ